MKICITSLLCLYLNKLVSSDCYWNTGCKYKYFSSKTPYEIVRGDIRDALVKQKGCEPISIWAIMRHGKRNPGIKFGQDIKNVLGYKEFVLSSYDNGNSSLCAQDVDNLRNWMVGKRLLTDPNEIANEGYQELTGIGSRLKEALPELLNRLHDDNYLFSPAYGSRIYDSAKAFIEGLKNKRLHIKNAANDYNVIAPYASCGKYQVEVLRNPNVYHAVNEYYKTKDYLDMKNRFEKRLGLNISLSDDNITAFYDLCRYSYDGINDIPSPWCALFSVEDLKVQEYIGDLRHYYRNGYGVPYYSTILGQIPLADLLTKFRQARNGRGKKIVSYFTHASMLDMIHVVFNLYKDTNPLTGAHRDSDRKWRTTFLSTFASNLIAVLNRCKEHGANASDYNVAFYWNEKPLLELCDKGVCSWQELEDKFKPFLNASTDICDFKWKIID